MMFEFLSGSLKVISLRMFAEFLPFHGVILHRCLFTFWPSVKKIIIWPSFQK